MQRIVAREVVDELAAAAQEAHVLDAFDRLPTKALRVAPFRRSAVMRAVQRSYHDGRLSVEQRARDAERRERRGLGVGP